MKTVQFKDIPSKVKDLMIRMNGDDYKQNDDIYLDWLHKWDKWSCATDDERLAYAEWRYKKDMKVKCAYDQKKERLYSADFRLAYSIGSERNDIWLRGDVELYDSNKNKWAEIIEEPFNLTDTGAFSSEPEKEETFEIPLVERKYADFVKSFLLTNNKYDSKNLTQEQHEYFVSVVYATLKAVNHFKEEQPEFKAGEIVDVWNTDTEMDLQPAKYRFFADGKHWVETCASDIVVNFKNIRKPDPDKHLREIAKDLIDKWVVVTEKRDELQTAIFTTDGAEQMLIEALKKGKRALCINLNINHSS